MAEFIGNVLLLCLYLPALAIYLVVFAPLIAAGRALGMVGQLLLAHGRLARVVVRGDDPQYQTRPAYVPRGTAEPATCAYWFGPAQRDLRLVTTHGLRLYRTRTADGLRAAADRVRTGAAARRPAAVPYAGTLQLGLLVGALLAAPLLAAALLLHALAITLVQAGGHLAAWLLRGLDRGLLWRKHLREGMLCPSCFERVRRPAYDCSRESCRRRHSELRPGRYGILKRRCRCGERLPTTLLGGSYRLPGYCTHPSCGKLLSTETGRLTEHALPLIGGRAAGKTQLMAALLTLLQQPDADGQVPTRVADQETAQRYQLLREVLEIRGHPRSTQRTLPRAHSVLLDHARPPRLLHLFDTAGERFVNREDTDALRYARAARTFVFVLDPLAVREFRERLDPAQQARLPASSVHPQLVFDQAVQAVMAMDVPLHRCRLAVAISKTDLLEAEQLFDGPQPAAATARDSDRAADWLERELGLGNLVQAMRNEFREVRFFCTAAVLSEDESVHPSIAPLLAWCLADGRRARRAAAAAAAAGRALAGRSPAGRSLAGQSLVGRTSAGRWLAGRASVGRTRSWRVRP
ncbi:hypothetical protein ACFZB9_10805 [Kitasatospora sp. NPDC008050]|uniref:TRAFAC clade GTPase domain-containing protein n=1 Tax=Kitasatospora sp. NPDC008050 TaxID=3364021 RepID=UPI0036EA67BF